MKSFVRFVLNVNIGTKGKPLLSTRNGNSTMIVQLIIQEVQAPWKLQVLSIYLNGQFKQRNYDTQHTLVTGIVNRLKISLNQIFTRATKSRNINVLDMSKRELLIVYEHKSDYKLTLLSDHKKLSGAGRLTNKVMNTLQNYYGMVIRSNVGNLYQMKKGIAAIIHHCSEYLVKVDGSDKKVCDDDTLHKFCPEGLESWYNYQKQKVAGEITYKPKINIPEAARDVIKPFFSYEDLAGDDLLSKCLHGQTQNANEAFNNCIWRKAPKDKFVARRTLEVAVASAVIHFNEGGNGMLQVFNNCGIAPGHFTIHSIFKLINYA